MKSCSSIRCACVTVVVASIARRCACVTVVVASSIRYACVNITVDCGCVNRYAALVSPLYWPLSVYECVALLLDKDRLDKLGAVRGVERKNQQHG